MSNPCGFYSTDVFSCLVSSVKLYSHNSWSKTWSSCSQSWIDSLLQTTVWFQTCFSSVCSWMWKLHSLLSYLYLFLTLFFSWHRLTSPQTLVIMIMEGSIESLSLSFDYKLPCDEEDEENRQQDLQETKVEVDDEEDEDKDVMRKMLFGERCSPVQETSRGRSSQDFKSSSIKTFLKKDIIQSSPMTSSGHLLKVPHPITVVDSSRRSPVLGIMTSSSNRSPNVLLTPNLDSLNTPVTTKEMSEGLTSFFGSHVHVVTHIPDPVPIVAGNEQLPSVIRSM